MLTEVKVWGSYIVKKNRNKKIKFKKTETFLPSSAEKNEFFCIKYVVELYELISEKYWIKYHAYSIFTLKIQVI